ncbi:MAG: hypothetical protein EB078_12855, partial [Proteobacteria bacterium]|nr:hypothetical protein [Pseudomonadota bacterium]
MGDSTGSLTTQGGINGSSANTGGFGRVKWEANSVLISGDVTIALDDPSLLAWNYFWFNASLNGTSTLNRRQSGVLTQSSYGAVNSLSAVLAIVGADRPEISLIGTGAFTFDTAWSNSSFGNLTVKSGQTVTINTAPGPFETITVDSGGTLTINTAITATNMTVNGTANVNAPINGLVNMTVGGTLTGQAFAFYKNTTTAAANAGTVPTWPVFSTDPVAAGFSAAPPNGNGRLVLRLTGDLLVTSSGIITMEGKGYPGGGAGAGQSSPG